MIKSPDIRLSGDFTYDFNDFMIQGRQYFICHVATVVHLSCFVFITGSFFITHLSPRLSRRMILWVSIMPSDTVNLFYTSYCYTWQKNITLQPNNGSGGFQNIV